MSLAEPCVRSARNRVAFSVNVYELTMRNCTPKSRSTIPMKKYWLR